MAGIKKFPYDLFLIVSHLILTNIFLLVPALNYHSFRIVLSLTMLLFSPGYALIAALFPAKSDLEGTERLILSFGLSIAVVPLIGLWLNFTTWGIRLLPTLISLSIFILVMCGIAYLRRSKLSETEVFEIPFKNAVLSLKAELLKKPGSKVDRALTVFLIFSIFLSVTTFFYVIVTPKEGEQFSEFYILGPEGVAENYPSEYVFREKGTFIVGIVNHEHRPMNYTMEVRLENKSLPLLENLRQVTLAHNETWEEPVTVTPPFEGTDMRLEFLLFNETDKTKPYRSLHLWIDVIKAEEA